MVTVTKICVCLVRSILATRKNPYLDAEEEEAVSLSGGDLAVLMRSSICLCVQSVELVRSPEDQSVGCKVSFI